MSCARSDVSRFEHRPFDGARRSSAEREGCAHLGHRAEALAAPRKVELLERPALRQANMGNGIRAETRRLDVHEPLDASAPRGRQAGGQEPPPDRHSVSSVGTAGESRRTDTSSGRQGRTTGPAIDTAHVRLVSPAPVRAKGKVRSARLFTTRSFLRPIRSTCHAHRRTLVPGNRSERPRDAREATVLVDEGIDTPAGEHVATQALERKHGDLGVPRGIGVERAPALDDERGHVRDLVMGQVQLR